MKNKLWIGTLVLFGSVLAACGSGYGAYYTTYGPPPPRYGVVGVAPGPGFVWTPGWWDLHGSRWAWREGAWVRPPHAHAVWVAPEWRHEGHGYRFHRGHWH